MFRIRPHHSHCCLLQQLRGKNCRRQRRLAISIAVRWLASFGLLPMFATAAAAAAAAADSLRLLNAPGGGEWRRRCRSKRRGIYRTTHTADVSVHCDRIATHSSNHIATTVSTTFFDSIRLPVTSHRQALRLLLV